MSTYCKKDGTVIGIKTKISIHNRDIISKYTSGLFKSAIFDFYGIKSTSKIKDLINVELPVVEVSEASIDFVFLMEDDTYEHFEFQTSYSIRDLTRFSRYDSLLYDRDGRKVQTVIIYSADVKTVDESLAIGSLTYTPTNVMMHKFNGNEIYSDLESKLKEKRELTDIDMLNLIFLPLMKNDIPKYELALKSVELAKTIGDRGKRETCIVSAIAFMGKYLNENQMNRIWGAVKMDNALGRLIQQEVDKEVKEERIKNAKSLLDILNIETISKKFNLTKEEVEALKESKKIGEE
ncbi:MAG: hypothetical protein FWG34_00010 [Oscillospiraceae bacterium]|nr:hypothetical protein [Oscillospiraceae bacterium]